MSGKVKKEKIKNLKSPGEQKKDQKRTADYENRFKEAVLTPGFVNNDGEKKRTSQQLAYRSSAFNYTDQQKFLQILAATGNVSHALQQVGVSRSCLNRHLTRDKEFCALYEEALEYAADMLEYEARRRAIKGVSKGIYYKGELVDTEKQYSDGLLITLLKGNKANKFANRTELSVTSKNIAFFSEMVAYICARDRGEDVSEHYTDSSQTQNYGHK